MKTPKKLQSPLPLLISAALVASPLVACEGAAEEAFDQATEALASAEAPEATSSAERPRLGKRGGGQGNRGPRNLSWFFDRFDEDGDGQVALADLPERKREWLEGADADGDGALTLAELEARRSQRRAEFMKQIDTDGDGEISDAESTAFRIQKHQERFERNDENDDGYLTEDEARPRRFEHLLVADSNDDRKLTLDEITSAIETGTLAPPPHRGPHGKRGCRGDGPRGPRGPRGDGPRGDGPGTNDPL